MIYIMLAITVGAFYYFKNYNYALIDVHAGIYKKQVNKGNKTSWIGVALLILFAGLRASSVGYDTANYHLNYECLYINKKWSAGHGFEFLYQLPNFLLSLFIPVKVGAPIVMLISSSIIVLCADFAIKKLTKNNTLGMLMFVTLDTYCRGFGQLRQMIAVSVIMVAFVFLKEKKIGKYILTCIIASLFHKVALIFLPFCVLIKKDFKYWFYIILAFGGILFCLFDNQFMKLLSVILGINFYDKYILTDYGIQGFSIVGYMEVVAYVGIFLFFLAYQIMYEKKHGKIKNQYCLWLKIFFCCAMCMVISLIAHKPELYGRLVYYFFWSLIFLVSSFIETIENKKIKSMLIIAIIIVSLVFMYLTTTVIDAYGIANYKTIFD